MHAIWVHTPMPDETHAASLNALGYSAELYPGRSPMAAK